MKDGFCVLYRYDDGYKIEQPPFRKGNKKVVIEVCDIPTAINKACEHTNGFSRIIYKNEKGDVFIEEFMHGNLIFSNNVSTLLR